ncbi:hypothetical protein GCM10020331_033210 [Ectobacillus funiculus]
MHSDYAKSKKSGHIINITSGLVREGAAGFGAYAASKAAIEALTYSVQDEEHKKMGFMYMSLTQVS